MFLNDLGYYIDIYIYIYIVIKYFTYILFRSNGWLHTNVIIGLIKNKLSFHVNFVNILTVWKLY